MHRILWLVIGVVGCTRASESVDGADAGPSTACRDEDRDGYGEGAQCRAADCDDTDDAVHPGAPEVCDGRDNDCNGSVDDGIVGSDCALGLGVCSGARQRCVDGVLSTCAGVASYGADFEDTEQRCDALDNDCDGFVDEACPCDPGQSQPCGRSEGECASGVQQCVEGRWGACEGEVGPADETCNGRDDDCDGRTDEDLEALRPDCPLSLGVCAGAQRRCTGEDWSACGPAEYGARYTETEGAAHCDGADNDCDGLVDEGDCPCDEGTEQACGVAIGACRPGSQRCLDGRLGECRGAVMPTDEVCNGVDDDCDGNLDDGLVAPPCVLNQGVCAGAGQSCGGAAGWQACDSATFLAHDARYVEAETAADCDGVDNDCDGATDEACGCADGQVQPCGANVGLCTQGEQRCADGHWGACSGVGPSVELCDGRDGDCDGAVDEGVVGPPCALSAGVCAGIRQPCANGVLRACDAESYGPRFEADEVACDQLDNDCDGRVDEGCACEAGTVQPCGTDEGLCERGRQTCVAGRWSACDGGIGPVSEQCNGRDEDCDTRSDEDVIAPPCALQQGVCAGRVQTCGGAGGFRVCGGAEYGPLYVAEEGPDQCDGRDNDCDGQTDERCECQAGGERPVCGSGVGACRPGRLICENGHFGACEGEVAPAAEACDGADNDCDGHVDEDLQPPTCALQAGVCAGTVRACGGAGGFQDCREATYGRDFRPDETAVHCDGLDNDCDGRTDEQCPAPAVLISELRVAGPGEDGESAFIELAGPPDQSLNGFRLEAVNGAGGRVYRTLDLSGARIPASGWFLMVEEGTANAPGASGVLRDQANLVVRGADLQNGPDSLRLVWNEQVVDAVGYGRFGAADIFAGEGMPAVDPRDSALSRNAALADTQNNADDFAVVAEPTPGGAPLPRVHIALRWDTDATDFDLHLLRGLFGTDEDCHWAVRTPPWGVNGERGDPVLVLDDRDGFGPEFINYQAPRADAEGYVVQVHYFSGDLGDTPPAQAEVLIYIDGVLAGAPSVQVLDGAQPYWAVALIQVAANGTIDVEPLDLVGNVPLEP